VGTQRDATVGRHDEAQPDEAQVGAFLFGVAALGDRGPLVRGVDVGREVGHVEHQPGQVDVVAFHDPGVDDLFDLT